MFETFRGWPNTFDKEQLELHCLRISTGEQKVSEEASTWCHGAEPDKLIEALWRVGLLRARAVGGLKALRRSGSSYLGSHQVPSLNLANVMSFHVHPMFRTSLAVKEVKKH